jgi:hypothetical protein
MVNKGTMGGSRKDPHSHEGNFCHLEGEGRNFFSDNSKCIGMPKGGRGLTSNFLHGGGMDDMFSGMTQCHYRVK